MKCTVDKCRSGKGRRGPSSFNMHDSQLVFNKLNLKEGDRFLDIGCGVGDYSLQAARYVGDSGLVYALDKRRNFLTLLEEEVESKAINNIKTIVSDIKEGVALEDNSIDVVFVATVLHALDLAKEGERIFKEIYRLLDSQGRLVIIECKKEATPTGPPLHMRCSADDLEDLLKIYGFKKGHYLDLGYNYMVEFVVG